MSAWRAMCGTKRGSNRPRGLRNELRCMLLLAAALFGGGAWSCRDSDTATAGGDGATRAAPSVSALPSAAPAPASVASPLVVRAGQFDGSICGLCPPDVWSDLPLAPDLPAPGGDDWSVLLRHPLAAPAPGSSFGGCPQSLDDALYYETRMDQVPSHLPALAAERWRGVLGPVWLNEPRLTKQRALRRGINGRDTLVAAWIKRGRWFQVMTTRRAFALRTSFEPRCGRGNPEQVAAALALGHQLLPAVRPSLCAEYWIGAEVGPFIAAGIHRRTAIESGRWPLTIKISIDDDRVLYSFSEPRDPRKPLRHPVPPWFDEKMGPPTGAPDAEASPAFHKADAD